LPNDAFEQPAFLELRGSFSVVIDLQFGLVAFCDAVPLQSNRGILATSWHALDLCDTISLMEKNRKIFCVGLMAELKIFRIFNEVIAIQSPAVR
jgi:hypothetical protein